MIVAVAKVTKLFGLKRNLKSTKFPVPEGVHSKEVDFFPYK